MERENKKRGREETELKAAMDADKHLSGRKEAELPTKRGKRTRDAPGTYPEDAIGDASDISGGGYHPLGVFEFPWRDEGLVLQPEDDAWDLRHVFFSSLVDGCSAAIGFPGDRLSRASAASVVIEDEGDSEVSWPSDGEADGGDCIWSCALSQPIGPAVYCSKASSIP